MQIEYKGRTYEIVGTAVYVLNKSFGKTQKRLIGKLPVNIQNATWTPVISEWIAKSYIMGYEQGRAT